MGRQSLYRCPRSQWASFPRKLSKVATAVELGQGTFVKDIGLLVLSSACYSLQGVALLVD